MNHFAHRIVLVAVTAVLTIAVTGCGQASPPPKPGTVTPLSYGVFGGLHESGEALLDTQDSPVLLLQVLCSGKCRLSGATLEHNGGRGGEFRLRVSRAGARRSGNLQRYSVRFAPGERARLYRTFRVLGSEFTGDRVLNGVELTVTGQDLHPRTQSFDATAHRFEEQR